MALVAAILLTFGVAMAQVAPAVRTDLAPTGKLRAGVNYGNFILAAKDPATGESRGVAIDLMRELAQRLGVPAEIVAYDSVAKMVDAAPTGTWDIAFLGADPARAGEISFTAAYLEIEATYLVPAESPRAARRESSTGAASSRKQRPRGWWPERSRRRALAACRWRRKRPFNSLPTLAA